MLWDRWKHITKLDPDKRITEKSIDIIVSSGTDAIVISGTQNVTEKNTAKILSMLKEYDIPKIIEPSNPESMRCEYDVDQLFIPSIMNAKDVTWLIGKHKEWVQDCDIDWDRIVPEAYIVMNPNSAVSRLTSANTDLNADEVAAYASVAEKYFNFPIVYIEYSGMYGDPSIVRSVKSRLEKASLFYGGGIDYSEKAREMKMIADVIVVGNVLYDDIERFLETIPGE